MTGYCMKCRAQRDMVETQPFTMKNGRQATQGMCAVCGTKITRFGAAEGTQPAAPQGKLPLRLASGLLGLVLGIFGLILGRRIMRRR